MSNLTSPLLYLSSTDAGWEGLVAQAFREPMEIEGWMPPATSDASLILIAGGALRMEQRHANGPWTARSLHHEDLILRPGMGGPHEVRWKALSPTPTRTLHLRLSTKLLARAAAEVADHDPAHVSLAARSGFRDPLIAQIGLALWRELERDPTAGKHYARSAAQLLAVHLVRHYTSAGVAIEVPAQGLTPQQMRRVVDCIQACLSQDLSLDSLAQQTGFSPYHFARRFRQTTGESPHQFVLRLRIEHARHLLTETDIPIARIAVESGFANQSHLTRLFKQHLGLTPRAYRQAHTI